MSVQRGGRRAAQRGHRRVVVLSTVAGLVALSGCQSDGQDRSAPGAPQEGSAVSAAPASFEVSVADKARNVRPDAALTVSAKNGTLHTVQLSDPKGNVLHGDTSEGTWRLADIMTPGATYTLSMTAENGDGATAKETRTFTTIVPKIEATYRVTPDKETVGVGMPVMVTFDSSVKTAAQRAAVEKRMELKVTPAQTGSWGWLSDNQLMWRPKTYWKPNTKVSVNAPLTGLQTGDGKFITENKGAAFTISSRSRISTVDLASHVMTVRENGKIVHTYPISGGQPTASYETRSGTKVITEKKSFMVMDAATLGVPKDDPNYYRTEVDYAMRVTNTGEFLHSAPWSVWAQGSRNVSHGCVNMGPNAAKAMFEQSIVGDVVDFTGSARRMQPGDGLSVWLFSYPEWQAKSALAKPAAKKSGAAEEKSSDKAPAKKDTSPTSSPTDPSTPTKSTPPNSAAPTRAAA